MSLAALALRIATVYALRGKTLAGAAVKDSPQNPLPERLQGVQICVYTGKTAVSPDVRDLVGGDQACDLSIHMHVPPSVDVTDGTTTLQLDAASGGIGIVFDMLWRQIVRVLMVDEGPWSELWRSLVCRVGEVDSEPFMIEHEKGVRAFGRDIMLPCMTICDPPFGPVMAGSPWFALLVAMRGEPALAALADLVENEITSPAGLTDWSKARAALGLTNGELLAAGLAPIVAGQIEPVAEWQVEVDDGTSFAVDATANDAVGLP